MHKDILQTLFTQVELKKCSDQELIKMFWILTSQGLNDEANQVADFMYLKTSGSAPLVDRVDLVDHSPAPLSNMPKWLKTLLPGFLWRQKHNLGRGER